MLPILPLILASLALTAAEETAAYDLERIVVTATRSQRRIIDTPAPHRLPGANFLLSVSVAL